MKKTVIMCATHIVVVNIKTDKYKMGLCTSHTLTFFKFRNR